MKRKKYSRKFQRMAVERMTTCESVDELARELGVRPRCLYKWRAKLEAVLRKKSKISTQIEMYQCYSAQRPPARNLCGPQVISPDGHVKTTRVVGGHPLLVQACQDALKELKFAPAPEETTQIVEFEFRAAE